MHRFFLPPDACLGTTIALDDRDREHAVRVLRLHTGDSIEVLDGVGHRLSARIVQADKGSVTAKVFAVHEQARPPAIETAPALVKGRAMEFLIQKATELGAASISPWVAARSVVRVDAAAAGEKVAGWRQTAIEACKQCGNAWLPRIDPPRTLAAFLEARRHGLLVAAMLGSEPLLPAMILDRAGNEPGPVTIVTGPEGDFAPDEQQALLRAGAVPFTLGPLVLRAETAVTAALAIFQHELTRRAPPG